MSSIQPRLLARLVLAAAASCPAVNAVAEESPNAFEGVAVAIVRTRVSNGIDMVNVTYVVQEPRLVTLCERWFVVGKPAHSDDKPALRFVNKTGIAWDNVVEFSTFTAEQFHDYAAETRAEADR